MRSKFVAALLLMLALSLMPASRGFAARDWLPSFGGSLTKPSTGDGVGSSGLELLVFEVEGCVYCDVMRRDVLPRYRTTPTGEQAPMRFVDINKVDTDKLALRGALQVVPTAVLMKDGKEVERIERYFGPEMFFQLVERMIEKAQ